METKDTEQSAVIYNQSHVNLNKFVISSNYYGDPNHPDAYPEEEMNYSKELEENPDVMNNSDEDEGDIEMIEEDLIYDDIVKEIQIQSGKTSKEDFTMLKVIGQGSYGKVFLVQHTESGMTYAMKVLK